MVAKTEKSQAMIEKILSTATQLFIHNGYEKTSVQNIAQTASISKGAIYHHFQSKDDIFFAVLFAFEWFRDDVFVVDVLVDFVFQ